jgi:hypothetical protein
MPRPVGSDGRTAKAPRVLMIGAAESAPQLLAATSFEALTHCLLS